MKKQIKILGVLAVALTLGLTACGGGGKDSQDGKDGSSSRHQHTAAENAPWQHDDSRHWKDCVANDGGKVDNKAHTWGTPTDVVPATCTEAGSQKVKCTVCGAEVTQTLQALGHDWVDDETGGTPATCTEAGSKNQHCSRCDATQEGVAVPALGHNYGEWTVVEGKAPTCTEKGQEQRVCDRCGDIETREVDALDHDLELVGGETPAPAGEATVRLYRCKRCGVEFLGFKADEPSAESLPHLMKGDHDGMRFFGRPIGNALALDKNGTSVNQQDNECVYCSTETGDFFEYVFTLNETQAASLATCRLYCDARPADHLSGDFWAYGRGNTDWTPGYYIDGADDHVQKDATTGEVVMVKDHARSVTAEDGSQAEGVELETEVKMGARIEDYRYILYVDNNPVEFDADTAVPVKGNGTNMTRAEYVLPYTFHLHAGTNRISLRMAGGYRSEFYNFVFRPYVEPTPVQINETNVEIKVGETAQITSSMTELKYASANVQVATVDANGLITGVKAGSTTITISKEGNYKSFKLPVKVNEKDGIYQVEVENGVSSKDEEGKDQITFRVPSGGASGSMTNAFPKDATLTMKFNVAEAGEFAMSLTARGAIADLGEAMSVKLNDADVSLAGKALDSQYTMVSTALGNVNLKAGENTIVVKALGDAMPNLDFFRFEPASELPPEPEHTHVYEDTKVDTLVTEGCTTVDVFNCKDGDASVLRWDAHNYDATSNDIAEKEGGIRLNKVENQGGTAGKGAHLIYKINSPVAVAKAGLAFDITPSSNNVDLFDAILKADGTSNDSTPGYVYEGENLVPSTKRYGLIVNGVEVQLGANDYGAQNKRGWYNWPVEFALKEGVNTIEIIHLGGYRAVMYNFQLTGFEKYVHVHNFVYGEEAVQKEGECDYKVGECASDHVKALKIDAGADLNKKLTRGGKLPKGSSGKYDGTAIASYKFTAPEGFGSKARLMAVATPDNAGNFDYSFYTGKTSSGSTQNPMQDGTTNTVVTINGVAIVLPKATYKEMGCTGTNEAGAGLVDFGEFNLAEGTNEFTLAATNSYGLLYWDFIIVAA